ncbi:MAG: Fic family protein [Treponema sp.]
MNKKNSFEIEFDEYIREVEPSKKEKADNWACAIGLQQVDGLTPSKYLFETARRNIEGEISIQEVKKLIHSYYESKTVRTDQDEETREADIVSARITELLNEKAFSFTPGQLLSIHKRLFEGVFDKVKAGQFRTYNITKKEWVLDGDTVLYSGAELIKQTLEYDFNTEKNFDYSTLSKDEQIKHLTRFIANIWQIHPFGEGNTRTTSVFTVKYLRSLGFEADNAAFHENSWYFRNALVRANYTNINKGIFMNTEYLEKFFRNLLLGEHNELKNRYCHIRYNEYVSANLGNVGVNEDDVGANVGVNEDDVGVNVGVNEDDVGVKSEINENKLLELIKADSSISAAKAAGILQISQRQTERLFASLKKKGLIKHSGADKNGKWELI